MQQFGETPNSVPAPVEESEAPVTPDVLDETDNDIRREDQGHGFIRRAAQFAARLYLPLILLLCMGFAWRPLRGSDDVWAHAAIGRWIWQNAQVPQETLFLWGTQPVEWIAHSWLSQLGFYLPLAVGGERYGSYLLIALTTAMVMLSFAAIWLLWSAQIKPERAHLPFFAPLIFTVALWAAHPRFHPRPELFTALFLACLLYFLVRWTSAKSAPPFLKVLWLKVLWLPAMFALWANFHGAVAVGLMLLGVTVVCELVQERFSPRSRMLLALALLCVAAVFLNPYGLQYWQALKPVGGAMFARIDEWKPFWKKPPLDVSLVWAEIALIAIAVVSWILNPQRRWSHLVWLIFMTASFVMARRHLWLLALVALAVIAANARVFDSRRLWSFYFRLTRRSRSAAPPIPDALRLAVRLAVIIYLIGWIATVTPRNILTAGARVENFPDTAARFMDEKKLSGRIFNDYEFSSYLQWHFGGRRPLFIDLLNAYPDQLLTDYFDILAANERGRKLLNEGKVQVVFLRDHKPSEGMAKLAKYLHGSAQWQRAYVGEDATIWTRRGEKTNRR